MTDPYDLGNDPFSTRFPSTHITNFFKAQEIMKRKLQSKQIGAKAVVPSIGMLSPGHIFCNALARTQSGIAFALLDAGIGIQLPIKLPKTDLQTN